MNDKEKLLIGIIIMLLGAVISYRIDYVDTQLLILESRINKLVESKRPI